MSGPRKRLTIPDLAIKKASGERLVMVAVGEVLSAAWAERAGVDIVGIGDSLGMTLYGHENTLAMTVDQMIEHTKAVRRGAPNTFSLVAMPYGSYATKDIAVQNAVRIMKESGVDAVKLQGGREMFDIIKAVDDAVSIFTFSIGAGAAGTCQLLNGYDLIGAFDTFKPKFAKRYGNVVDVAVKAFEDYAEDVRSGAFPDADHSYKMKAEEVEKFTAALTKTKE